MTKKLSDYGSGFISLADVKAGPIRKRIAGMVDGKYDKPDLIFTDGSRMSLNATNRKTLQQTFGDIEDDLIGNDIELIEGEFEFQKKMSPGVAVRPISPPPAKPNGGGGDKSADYDDEIPF